MSEHEHTADDHICSCGLLSQTSRGHRQHVRNQEKIAARRAARAAEGPRTGRFAR